MDGFPPAEQILKFHKESKIDNSVSRTRKVVQKTVITFRTEADAGKQKSECPPSDFWSWRKYGQKLIKGSPYPRGYYRCSTSKGCSAKKQVERSKTDSSVLIITYTSDHNHPGPHLPSVSPNKPSLQSQSFNQDCPTPKNPNQPNPTSEESLNKEKPPLQSPPKCSQEVTLQNPPTEVEGHYHQANILFNEGEPLPPPNSMTFSSPAPKTNEENDFFSELEELPIPSSITSSVRESFVDERILFLPSQTIFS